MPKEVTVYVESPIYKKRDMPDLQKTFLRKEDEYLAAEQRILYMDMSRACKKLDMTYFGKFPRPYRDLRRQNLADFVG